MHYSQDTARATHFQLKNLHGFTLIELMIVITMIGILATIGVPAFNNVLLGSKLNSSANSLVASAYLARSEAIKRNAVVTLCVSSNGTSCASGGWEQGWIVSSGTTVIHKQPVLPSGFKLTESGGISSISFQPTGVGATQATLTACRATPSAGNQERVVTISASGRASVKKTTTGTCS